MGRQRGWPQGRQPAEHCVLATGGTEPGTGPGLSRGDGAAAPHVPRVPSHVWLSGTLHCMVSCLHSLKVSPLPSRHPRPSRTPDWLASPPRSPSCFSHQPPRNQGSPPARAPPAAGPRLRARPALGQRVQALSTGFFLSLSYFLKEKMGFLPLRSPQLADPNQNQGTPAGLGGGAAASPPPACPAGSLVSSCGSSPGPPG